MPLTLQTCSMQKKHSCPMAKIDNYIFELFLTIICENLKNGFADSEEFVFFEVIFFKTVYKS